MALLANQLELLEEELGALRQAADPETAEGEMLDRHADSRGLRRKEAAAAGGVLRFYREEMCIRDSAMAAYRYRLLGAGQTPDSLKVGEITLTSGGSSGGIGAAAALQQEYLAAVRELVDTGAFCFERVRSHGV